MTAETETQNAAPSDDQRSYRPVVEHALIDYGYSPDLARTIVDRLIAEGRET